MVKQIAALLAGAVLIGIGGWFSPASLLVAAGVVCGLVAVYVIDDGADR